MSIATISISLPTTRADGTPFDASMYGGAHILRDGTIIVTLAAPSLVGVDAAVVPGKSVYTAAVFDTQTPPATSAESAPVTAGTAPVVLAAPGAPTISVIVS